MILTPLEMLFAMVVLHNIADYPLQGPFLSEAKNRNTALGAVYWPFALSAHALIQGGAVFLVTHNLVLALLESAIHAMTDWLKCEGEISMWQDQAIHYGCKVLWTWLFFAGIA